MTAPEPTPSERDALIRSVISSEALSGLYIDRETAERMWDAVMNEPPISVGEPEPTPRSKPHEVEDGDGACGDCGLCVENLDDACIVADSFRCAWCGHCTRTHTHRGAPEPTSKQPSSEHEHRWKLAEYQHLWYCIDCNAIRPNERDQELVRLRAQVAAQAEVVALATDALLSIASANPDTHARWMRGVAESTHGTIRRALGRLTQQAN